MCEVFVVKSEIGKRVTFTLQRIAVVLSGWDGAGACLWPAGCRWQSATLSFFLSVYNYPAGGTCVRAGPYLIG